MPQLERSDVLPLNDSVTDVDEDMPQLERSNVLPLLLLDADEDMPQLERSDNLTFADTDADADVPTLDRTYVIQSAEEVSYFISCKLPNIYNI